MGVTASPEHRVFFALQPDAAAAEQAIRLASTVRQKHGMSGRVTAASRLHVSLNYVGSFRGPPTKAVMEKAMGVAATVVAPAFQLAFNRVESWKGDPNPLVLLGDEGVIGVQMLYAALHKALVAKTMAPRREPEMWPHMALLWDKRQAPAEHIEPIGWRAEEFVMLDSVQGEGRHEVLGRWALTG